MPGGLASGRNDGCGRPGRNSSTNIQITTQARPCPAGPCSTRACAGPIVAAGVRSKETCMCEIFISADPASYESRTRSVRLHGVVTSIRLEHLYWEVLEEIARRDGMTVVHLIEKLYDELVTARGGGGNMPPFLRAGR